MIFFVPLHSFLYIYKIEIGMKHLLQFLIIIAFSFVGEIMHYFIPLPIPASIYGIVLLFVALETKLVNVHQVRDVSIFLIATMPIMFLPPAVGLIESWDSIKDHCLQYLAITFISTFVVMGVAGGVTQFVIRQGKRKDNTK